MEFAAAILFLILYFVRLHDWVPGLAGLNVIKPVMAMALVGLLTRRARVPAWRWMRTPHEWIMVCYCVHGIHQDPDWQETMKAVLPLLGFAVLTGQALTDEARLEKFFKWWTICVSFMCIVGVAADFGIDLTGAKALIDAQLGRLCLNTWLLDNPNALGHFAITGFPLVFYTMVFRRDLALQLLAIPLLLLIGQCVVATGSKGAYISGAAGIATIFLMGRSLVATVAVGTMLALGGIAVSSKLPRMNTSEDMRYDEGVMGRALAFEAARAAYETQPAGWNRFVATFQVLQETKQLSTHSSIVQVGADQGPLGLFLFLSIIACSARSLLMMKTESEALERCRRLMFCLLVCYFASGWMINRSYSAEFFLLAGAIMAFHKLAQERLSPAATLQPEDSNSEETETAASSAAPDPGMGARGEGEGVQIEPTAPATGPVRFWNRYGLVDLGIGYALMGFTIWVWDYLIGYFRPG